MPRPVLELADIFRLHGNAYRQTQRLGREHLRLMRAIELCRTAALGGHVEKCGHCDFTRISYNSCRNRHCPKCQSLERAKWLAKRKDELLPVEYFHVVFTIPDKLSALALQNKKAVYDILFRAASETLLTLARDPKHLGAEIGFFAILHTWGQNLLHHPHLHCVVPGGGLDPGGKWVACRRGFFLPVRVLSRLFRRLFLTALEKAFRKDKLHFHGDQSHLGQGAAFDGLVGALKNCEWVVYAKPPFGGPLQVLEYLGRYTHRVAISNQRLVAMKDGHVSFQWKDYRQGNQSKVMKLEVGEFIRRFLLHSLPSGFQRIRHCGLLANRHRKDALAACRRALATPVSELLPQPAQDHRELYEALTRRSLQQCPRCGTGVLAISEILPPIRFPLAVVVDSS